ncbi:MAG: TspO/MBR family protein [Candidatus Micrarchaeota archaeon]
MKIDFKKMAVSFILCFLAAAVGSIFTGPAIGAWYAGLAKPALSPPNWVFAPAWTALYIMMAVSLYLVWMKKPKKTKIFEFRAVWWFKAQLALNTLWSVLFFGLRSPEYGLMCIFALLAALAGTIYKFYKIDKTAAYLLVPYFCWCCFATYLNLMVAVLN